MNICENIAQLTEEVNQACRTYKRDPGSIKIIAASKYADARQIIEASECGIRYFGENRAEDLEEKYSIVGNRVTWHFIGHLQSRKAKAVVLIADLIHSVDSLKILQKIDMEAQRIGKIQKVLLELNLSGEESKYGISADEARYFLNKAPDFNNTAILGFMTMAPLTEDAGIINSVFSGLAKTMAECRSKFPDIKLKELSMGMSNDYKIAISLGATMIRIGSLIFL
jgi:pyridoxal phosphate enzyme (YggS family)